MICVCMYLYIYTSTTNKMIFGDCLEIAIHFNAQMINSGFGDSLFLDKPMCKQWLANVSAVSPAEA